MKPVDLTKALKPYKTGWVAIDKNKKVIAHAKDFAAISEKVQGNEKVILLPVLENYFGFIT